MKVHQSPLSVLFSSVLLVFFLACIAANAGKTNGPNTIILPPEDWDVNEHMLIPIVTTNVAGNYLLPTTWMGEERVTARTGWYSGDHVLSREAAAAWQTATNFEMRADSVLSRRFGNGILHLVSGDVKSGAAYRQQLPSDSALLAITNTAAISNLLGWNPFAKSTNFTSISLSYFSLRPYDSIELLGVTFSVRGDNPNAIHSTLVKRGKLHPLQRKN